MAYHYNQRETFIPQKHTLSLENKVIGTVCDWLASQVVSHSNLSYADSDLQTFKKEVSTFLKDRMNRLHCANLRTIADDSNLYQIAQATHIPCDALPNKISIIVTSSTAYYFISSPREKLPIFP